MAHQLGGTMVTSERASGTRPDVSECDPEALGQLCLLPSSFAALSSAAEIAALVEQELNTIPGIRDASVWLATTIDALVQEPPPSTEGVLETGQPHVLPIQTRVGRSWGQVQLHLDAPARYRPYVPFVQSLLSSMATELEKRANEERQPAAFSGLAADVTAQKEMEQALRESQMMLRLVLDTIPQGVFWKDCHGRYLGANAVAARASGFEDPLDLVGLTSAELPGITPEQAAFFQAKDREVMERGTPLLGIEEPRGHPDGSTSWLRTNKVPLRDAAGRIVGVLGTWEDVTEEKEAEAALRAFNETLEEHVEERTRQVRMLVSKLTMAEQEERYRISQILHDDLQQRLYGILMRLSLARQDAEDGHLEDLLKQIIEAEAWLRTGIEITRTLTVDLSPPVLKSEGLTDMLGWLVEQMQELHGLEVTLVVEHAFHTPEESMRVLLFQIVRELLFNVVKHAGTNRATVELHDINNHVQICVIDEGAGFDAAATAAEQGEGFGLSSVRERLCLFGGDLKIDSVPGKGTRVIIDVPLRLA